MTTAVVDIFMTYQFIKRLTAPFNKWPAYKEGVIDKDGNILIKRKDLKTQAQRASFRLFDLLTLNMKKLLGKLPGGKSKIATYAAALFLIKEGQKYSEENIDFLEEDFANFFSTNATMIAENMEEDAPTTSTAGVAGLGADDLKVSRKARRTYKQHNANTTSQMVRMVRRRMNNA
jgi:hypothetical protein